MCIPWSRYAEIGALPLIFCPVFPTVCEKTGSCRRFILKRSFCQDRLGTNAEKTHRKVCCLAGHALPWRLHISRLPHWPGHHDETRSDSSQLLFGRHFRMHRTR
jgi:hypothetical protein